MAQFTVKIDQLPAETIAAVDPREAAHKVAALITGHDKLRRLADDEPVEIKRPDGRPWGRHLTIGDFRGGLLDEITDEIVTGDGPERPAKP